MRVLDRRPDRVPADVLRPDRRQPGGEGRSGGRRAEPRQVGREHVGGQLPAERQHGVRAADDLGWQRLHDRGLGLRRVRGDPGPGVDERRGKRLEVVVRVLVAQVRRAEGAVRDRLEGRPRRAGHRPGQEFGLRHQEVVAGCPASGLDGPRAEYRHNGEQGHRDPSRPCARAGEAEERPGSAGPGAGPTRVGVARSRDARWAPMATADMMLLPTWTPPGDGERRHRLASQGATWWMARGRRWGIRGKTAVGDAPGRPGRS